MGDADTENQPPISLPTWLSEKYVLVAWMAGFGILILLSFFIFVPIAVTMNDTEGNCFLYAGASHGYGASSVCSYCIACAVIFLCICGLRLSLLIMKMTHISSKITDKITLWLNIWGVHIVILCLDVMLAFLLLVTSCLLSVGLSSMCEDLFKGRERCSSTYGVKLPKGNINYSFYQALSMAEGAAWFTFCFWLLVLALETFLLWKNGSLRKIVFWRRT